jgi:acetylornithine deacetylase
VSPERIVELLCDLVAVPSVNPMGRPLDPALHLEGRMVARLERVCAEIGVPCRRVPVLPGRDNLIARFDAPSSTRTVLFDVHMDTVPVDGMTIAPFEPRIEGGRLYGRGSCDVKGSMAAMIGAVARLAREKPPGAASVVLAFTVDEEYTHRGSSALAADHPPVDLAIVAEPTGLDLVTTHKGAVRWKIVTHGVAGHSSAPERGDNAIYRMAKVVSALEELARELRLALPDAMLGPPSLSVGRIDGGQSVNIIPDRCEIEIDRRLIPGEGPDEAPTRVAESLRDRLGSLDHIEFLPPWVRMPALVPGVGPEMMAHLARSIERVTGREPAIKGVPFGTDAGPLGRAGVPCVVLGPGDIAQAHTKDEWVAVDEVLKAAEVYFEIARNVGQGVKDSG